MLQKKVNSPILFRLKEEKVLYSKESFEELDVMNFYMFNKLTTQPNIADKFCKCMIRNLLGREVDKIRVQAEKMEFPDNPSKRGVRLDVEVKEMKDDETVASIYDIEPHRITEKEYPKKNRYTLAHIDKNNLKKGDDDFSHLPDVYIVCITNYDPFGYDRLVYTIKNRCVEVPELVYNDGVQIIYFNTTGKNGGTRELKAFLRYLEESNEKNVIDSATNEMNDYVNAIKHNGEIGGIGMTTLGQYMDRIVEDAVSEAVSAAVAEKDIQLADKDAKIAELQEQLDKLQMQDRK